MGCFWSNEDSVERCHECYRKAKNNLTVINNICEICSSKPSTRQSIQLKPRYGRYKCTCGRRWVSRCAWSQAYQICNGCRKPVFAYELRELQPGDISLNVDKDREHKMELCQMCIQLGRYCGSGYNQRQRSKTPRRLY